MLVQVQVQCRCSEKDSPSKSYYKLQVHGHDETRFT